MPAIDPRMTALAATPGSHDAAPHDIFIKLGTIPLLRRHQRLQQFGANGLAQRPAFPTQSKKDVKRERTITSTQA
ncbi:MAG: hypothetical protein E5W83_15070 [Mesorhizobium sp.]|nr:MAG: hypothetical protein E5W83_15070 [Mesorhizobium sp.]